MWAQMHTHNMGQKQLQTKHNGCAQRQQALEHLARAHPNAPAQTHTHIHTHKHTQLCFYSAAYISSALLGSAMLST
jgi:hypothetical protein